MHTFRRRLLGFFHRHPQGAVALLLSPAAAWLLAFTLLPLGIVVYYSFLTRGPWGSITYTWTLENYRQLLDPLFLQVFLRSLRLALLTTGLCLLAGYLLAYWITFSGGRYKSVCIFLVILPFWTSDLVRVYAWMTLLADHGVINNALSTLGLIRAPLPLLYNEFAVLVGLVYAYLPFMILPLYAALERLDRTLLEAAADLGATPVERFIKVTLPLTKGGMLSGSVLVFVPCIGEFLIPELLGGAKAMLLGKFIALKITGLRHWPLGAAYSLLLLGMILLLLGVYVRFGGGKEAFQEQEA
jgi:spermidine/putrescine transport system permease protein